MVETGVITTETLHYFCAFVNIVIILLYYIILCLSLTYSLIIMDLNKSEGPIVEVFFSGYNKGVLGLSIYAGCVFFLL